MAYDPEARETSNSAMIIGIVALVLVIGAVLAYYATRGNDNVADVAVVPTGPNPPTTVVQKETQTVPVPVPVPGETTVVEKAVPVPGPSTRVETHTSTSRE